MCLDDNEESSILYLSTKTAPIYLSIYLFVRLLKSIFICSHLSIYLSKLSQSVQIYLYLFTIYLFTYHEIINIDLSILICSYLSICLSDQVSLPFWELIFIYCGLFVLILVVFVLFLLSLCFGQISPLAFFRWLTAISDRNTEFCNRIPRNYCLPIVVVYRTFFRWLTAISDRNTEFCNRIPRNYCLP